MNSLPRRTFPAQRSQPVLAHVPSRRSASLGLAVLLAWLGWTPEVPAARPPEALAVRAAEQRVELSLPQEPVPPVGGSRFRHRVEGTTDLESWTAAGELATGASGVPSLTLPPESPHRFFRLASDIELGPGEVDGSELWGYGRVFAEELHTVGYLTPAEFAARHQPGPEWLEQLDFDPRTGLFWETFAADPAVVNQGKKYGDKSWRTWDFRLNEAELALFLKNGFVVSPRLGSTTAPNTLFGTTGNYQVRSTFADLFYRVFNDDLPVFISADAALHAWHYSFSRLLSEIEQTHLIQLLGQIFDGMTDRLARVPPAVRSGPFKDNFNDVDYFLAVGRSLLSGTPSAPLIGPDTDVKQTLKVVAAGQWVEQFPMFGGARDIDFSQFVPRGPYTRSDDLSRYFRAFQWSARADFRILDPDHPAQAQRELGDAIVLALLLQESAPNEWRDLDRVLRLLVGRTDALDFAQWKPLLELSGLRSLADLSTPVDLAGLQARLLSGSLGVQLIPGDVHFSPFGPEQAQLPRSFVLTGQRFVPDGWAMAQVTFDRVRWFEEIPGATVFGKVTRRVPAVPDVAYAVLGNSRAGWLLGERMVAPRTAGNFRDGYPYAHNLTALARTFDRLEPSAWTDTIYSRWLWALRALSPTNVDPRLPQAMRTRAWAMHSLNTQLASYSQLKHDTLLYGKQPYAANILCEYPAGFVEPVPEFWQRLGDLARATADGLSAVTAPTGTVVIPYGPTIPVVDRLVRHQSRIDFCRQFAARMDQLRDLAEKELRQEPYSASDLLFIQGLMNNQSPLGYGGATYDGWYPKLFYEDYTLTGVFTVSENGSNQWDPRVADLFTAPPDQVDPVGGVLHAATGNVDLLLISVDNGPDRMVYAGPVMSYYEFLEPGPTLKRLTDEEWQQRLTTTPPPRPPWTAGHIAPGK